MLSSFSFFQDRYIAVDTPEDFFRSEVGMYLTSLYGKLIYTEEPTYNFLNVHKESGKMIVSEGLFIELFPDKPKTGTILPESMFQILSKNYTGGTSEACKNLSEQGFHVFNLEVSENVTDNIKKKKLKTHNFENRGCEYVFADTIFDEQTSTFKDTSLYYLHDEEITLMDDVDRKIIAGEKGAMRCVLNHLFLDNKTLNNAEILGLRLHRMTPDSPPIQRHFDPSFYCKELMYMVRWVPDSRFKGREIVFEKFVHPSYDKMKEFVLCLLNFKTDGQPTAGDDCFEVQAIIKPTKVRAVLMTGFNPLFVHGVNKMLSGKGVYTLVTNVGIKDFKC